MRKSFPALAPLPAVEWSWQGNEDGEGEEVFGRGWAVLDDDGPLRGRFFIHDLDDFGFEVEKGHGASNEGT